MRSDVLIVGAGPAGSALGGLLASRGIDVVMVDRATFPRPKPCGESVNPGAVKILHRLGLSSSLGRCAPAPIRGWRITTKNGPVVEGRYDPAGGAAVGVQRVVFDQALVAAARSRGATLIEGVAVHGIEPMRNGYRVCVRRLGERGHGGEAKAWSTRFLVGADGLRSVVSRRLGLLRRRPRIRKLSMTCHVAVEELEQGWGYIRLDSDWTIGLAPVHETDNVWNATVVWRSERFGRAVARDPLGSYRLALSTLPLDHGPEIVRGPWTSGPFDYPTQRIVADHALLVGDATGYYDPLTGQGICHALRSAELAATTIETALVTARTAAADLVSYHNQFRNEVRPVRMFQRGVEATMCRSLGRRILLNRLHAAPAYADRIVRVAGDAAPLHSLLSTDLFSRRAAEVAS